MIQTKWAGFFAGTLFMFSLGNTGSGTQATDAHAQDLKPVTTPPASDYHVKWSPDGTLIAFSSNRSGNTDIWVKHIGDNKIE